MPVSPINERGYANPGLLVETGWLSEHLKDENLRLIDVRSSELYEAGHIPGAVSMAAHGGIPRAENGDMGSPEAFSAIAGEMGIEAGSTVVIYDAPGAQMGMAAWAFSYYGHGDVRVLDGGYKKWTAEARLLATERAGYPAVSYEARLVDEVYCSLDYAKSAVDEPGTIFWDTRSLGEYEGSDARNNARPGRIPNAVHLDWTELLDSETGTFKPAPALRELLEVRGITPEAEIACY